MKSVNMIDVVLISAIFRKRTKLQAINQVNLRVAPRRAFERNNNYIVNLYMITKTKNLFIHLLFFYIVCPDIYYLIGDYIIDSRHT